MFLSKLNEKQKELFTDLAVYIANCNNDFNEYQKNLINAYRREMGMSVTEPLPNIKNKSQLEEEIRNSLNDLESTNIKKEFLFELIGLAICDSVFDKTEQQEILSITEILKLDKSLIKEYTDLIQAYLDLQNKILKAVK